MRGQLAFQQITTLQYMDFCFERHSSNTIVNGIMDHTHDQG